MRFTLDRRDPDDRGPSTFRHEAVLAAEPDEVFAVLAAEEPWPQWFPDLVRSRWLTPAPHGVGSLRAVELRAGQSVLEHFVCWRPGERMTFYLERASVPLVSHLVEDYVLEPVADGTRLTWQVHWRPRRPLRPLVPLLAPAFDRMFATGIANLSRWVEDQHRDR